MKARKGEKALPPAPPGTERENSGRPGGGQGRVDLTGVVPGDVRVDPDLTEGHPGYQDSGDSEIIPPKKSGGGEKR